MHFTWVTAEFYFPTTLRTALKCSHVQVREDGGARAQPSLEEEICLLQGLGRRKPNAKWACREIQMLIKGGSDQSLNWSATAKVLGAVECT